MHVFAVWPGRTKAESVIGAHFLVIVFRPMPKLALCAADFAEASFVVGTLLLLLGGARLLFLGVAVYTLGRLLVAVSVFLEEFADGNFFLHIQV